MWKNEEINTSTVEFMLHQEDKRVGRELEYRLNVMLGHVEGIFCVRMILSKQMLNLDTNLILLFLKFLKKFSIYLFFYFFLIYVKFVAILLLF